jgi:hypothetical protein
VKIYLVIQQGAEREPWAHEGFSNAKRRAKYMVKVKDRIVLNGGARVIGELHGAVDGSPAVTIDVVETELVP